MIKRLIGVSTFALACAAGTAAAQDISTVNGFNVQLRQFNDFAGSILNWGPAGAPVNPAPVPGTFPLAPFGAGVEFNEQFPIGTAGNFANKHQALFSNDGGATPFGVNQFQSFTINTDITETTPAGGPRKEGGIKFYNNRGGGFIDEGEVMVASDNGEVAVFGANQSFVTFGAGAYTPGTTAHITYNYFAPGVISNFAAYQLIFTDAITGVHNSGILDFDHNGATDPTNPANGFNTGSTLGFLDQNQRNPFGDSIDIRYGNTNVIPTPGVGALLGLAGFAGLRRKR